MVTREGPTNIVTASARSLKGGSKKKHGKGKAPRKGHFLTEKTVFGRGGNKPEVAFRPRPEGVLNTGKIFFCQKTKKRSKHMKIQEVTGRAKRGTIPTFTGKKSEKKGRNRGSLPSGPKLPGGKGQLFCLGGEKNTLTSPGERKENLWKRRGEGGAFQTLEKETKKENKYKKGRKR